MKAVFLSAWSCVFLVAALAAAPDQISPQPVWSVDIQGKLGLRSFQTEFGAAWHNQQDVVFLTPERVLLYQVNQLRNPARLAGRGNSGGAGNFFLEIRILDLHHGHLLKSVQLPTSAGFSKVIPTHGGRMIVRTGDSLFLCTEDFQPVASRTLPIKGEVAIEAWQMGLSPSGQELALVHQQIKPSLMGPDQSTGGWALSEIEILDADTLKTVKAFSIPHALASWSTGEGVLLTSNPAPSNGAPRFGSLDYAGKWTRLELKDDRCAYQLDAFRQGYMAAYGCGRITLLNARRENVFSHDVAGRYSVGSVGLSGQYLAIEVVREVQFTIPGTNFPVIKPKSERLEVFDIATNKRLLSLPAHSGSFYYEISADGNLAVVDGSSIALYRVDASAKDVERQ